MSYPTRDVSNVWYLENTETGFKLKVPDNRSPHDLLDQIAPDDKKHWCLRYGPLEEPETEKKPETEVIFPDGTSQIFYDDSIVSERRAHPRKEIPFKVTLISGNRIFRTYCENISLGGLM